MLGKIEYNNIAGDWKWFTSRPEATSSKALRLSTKKCTSCHLEPLQLWNCEKIHDLATKEEEVLWARTLQIHCYNWKVIGDFKFSRILG
uniref:Uncharacterized protein n=1 Tax=Physcomitrium patens TaxID=3218 RepID=A0A2K1IF26_PHYPA|nr:hypothetical protein PHYPA_028478 [Physcomitrium patens]